MYTMLGAVAALREESGMFLRPNEGSADLAATLVAAERLAIKVDGERLGAVNAAAGDARTTVAATPRRMVLRISTQDPADWRSSESLWKLGEADEFSPLEVRGR